MRLWNAAAMVVALFALVTALLGMNRQPAAGAGEEGVQQELAVTLTEFALEPADLQLEVGRPAVLTITNEGTIAHDFEVEGVAKTEVIQPGDSTTLELEALEARPYAVRCTVPGHDASGMTGTLAVSEATGETTDVRRGAADARLLRLPARAGLMAVAGQHQHVDAHRAILRVVVDAQDPRHRYPPRHREQGRLLRRRAAPRHLVGPTAQGNAHLQQHARGALRHVLGLRYGAAVVLRYEGSHPDGEDLP